MIYVVSKYWFGWKLNGGYSHKASILKAWEYNYREIWDYGRNEV